MIKLNVLRVVKPLSVRVNILGILFAILFLTCFADAQRKLEPAPENFKVADQLDSPLQLTINGLYPVAFGSGSFEYSVRNKGTREVDRAILKVSRGAVSDPVYIGWPDDLYEMGYDAGLVGGASRVFSLSVNRYVGGQNDKSVKPEDGLVMAVDFVLFKDGGKWGADTMGQADFLLGLVEGQKKFLSEVRDLVGTKDETSLKALISRDGPPDDMPDIHGDTKRLEGIRRGYFAAKFVTRADLEGRGDLSGVPARIRDLERMTGDAPADDKKKQVSQTYMFNPVVKITNVKTGGRTYAFDERFLAAGDWLADMRLTVQNISGKTIKAVLLGLHFPETVNTGIGMVSSSRYGPHPITQAENDREPTVAPGRTFEIRVDHERPGLKRFLETRQSFDSISRITVQIDYVEFDDGTRWSGGQYTKQDPDNPKRWIPIK